MPVLSVTQLNKACGEGLAPLISYIKDTQLGTQDSFVGSNIEDCKLGFFRTHPFPELCKITNRHQAGSSAFIDHKTYVPISWLFKKQTAVSHSRSESEIISLGAGLRIN